MIYDLNVAPPPFRKLRIAIHGHGIYQRDFINDPLGIEASELASEIKIYPNPAQEMVFIYGLTSSEIKEVRLYDMLGNDTGRKYVYGGIDIQSLANGVYLAEIITSEGKVTKRIVKE